MHRKLAFIYLLEPLELSNGNDSTQSILIFGSTVSDPLRVLLPTAPADVSRPNRTTPSRTNSPGLISSGGPSAALPGPKASNASLSMKNSALFLFSSTGTLVYRNALRKRSLRSAFDSDLLPTPVTNEATGKAGEGIVVAPRRNCTVVSFGVK